MRLFFPSFRSQIFLDGRQLRHELQEEGAAVFITLNQALPIDNRTGMRNAVSEIENAPPCFLELVVLQNRILGKRAGIITKQCL